MKKFEEGVFSDLRNLKPGVDACLEDPKVSYSNKFCADNGGRQRRGGREECNMRHSACQFVDA